MRQWTRWAAAVVALLVASATPARDGAPSAADRLDAALSKSLREVINTGAALYNKSDHAGCYRIYQGGLTVAQGLLDHHPDLQKAISTGLAAAERDPLVWRRAFTLRAVLDKVRKGLAPRTEAKDKGAEKPPMKDDGDKKPEEKKPEEKKEPEKKEPVKKAQDKKEPEKKSDEKKGSDKQVEKKDDPQKGPEKKPDEKKAPEKKDQDKKDDGAKGPEKTAEKKDDAKEKDKVDAKEKDDPLDGRP